MKITIELIEYLGLVSILIGGILLILRYDHLDRIDSEALIRRILSRKQRENRS